jgi:hypothetical protein
MASTYMLLSLLILFCSSISGFNFNSPIHTSSLKKSRAISEKDGYNVATNNIRSITSTFTIHLAKRDETNTAALNREPLELCDESADQVIEEIRSELGTIFGYDQGSRDVGITGWIELVEVDGPTVSVRLGGRFWHATDTVMLRVESFIKIRIPEVIEVLLDMSTSEIQDDNRLNTTPEDIAAKKLY